MTKNGKEKLKANQESAILEEVQLFEEWYRTLEENFNISDLHETEKRHLVSPVANFNLPVHRWYTLKEAYSSDLPYWLITYLSEQFGYSVQSVFDPFIGGGTTGVSLAQRGIDVYGIEHNPFIYFVAHTKSCLGKFELSKIQSFIENLQWDYVYRNSRIPELSTIRNDRFFHESDARAISGLVQLIMGANLEKKDRNFLLLGVASVIETVANLRKDGRALRYVEKINKPSVHDAVVNRWNMMLEDARKNRFKSSFEVSQGSATDSHHQIADNRFDLVLYSPPYLNNFDYSEIYKLELWFLEFINSIEQWHTLRKSTIRSHHSLKFDTDANAFWLEDPTDPYDIRKYIGLMQRSICLLDDETRVRMAPVIQGYFEDMATSLREQWRVLKSGGYLVYVVANSRHKYLPIATDVILGAIAQEIGFLAKEVVILRKRNGRTRQKNYLRETAVILQKPLS